jgi:hypothetical protein
MYPALRRASSTLQKNSKLYGPSNALDIANESSCWNSEGIEGATHHFELDFRRFVRPQEIRIQFQAGFIAETCSVQLFVDSSFQAVANLEFEDVHAIQTEALPPDAICETTKLRLAFDNFTDFYGRIIIYRVEVWGEDSHR